MTDIRTKVFCLIFKISSARYKGHPDINFEIHYKLSKICHFEVERSKFYQPNVGDFLSGDDSGIISETVLWYLVIRSAQILSNFGSI